MSAIVPQQGAWVEPATRRQLTYHIWRPASGVRRVLIVIHGFGEHGGRYERVGHWLASEGFMVAVPDLWGHGRSGGRRGEMHSVAQCVHDCTSLLEHVFLPLAAHRRYALYGHSFGGLVAIQWVMANPPALTRAVIQSPLLRVAMPIPQWKTFAAALLAHCWARYAFRMDLDASALSHDPSVVAAYRSDPLVHNVMSAGAYWAIRRTSDEVVALAQTVQVPILLLTGGADRIVSVEAAQRWFDRLTCEKQSRMFPECYHELHHEAVFNDVVRLVRDWTLFDD